MAELIIRTGKHQGRKIRLPDNDVVIGRDEVCQIRLDTEDVSRRHCALKISSKGWLINDLGSRNGTILNGQRIESETLLKPGDVLTIGPMEFEFTDQAAGQKKPGEGKQSQEKQVTTDDEIADWLMEENEQSSAGSGSKSSTASIGQTLDESKSRSIAEEAADIIRRHQEMQSGKS